MSFKNKWIFFIKIILFIMTLLYINKGYCQGYGSSGGGGSSITLKRQSDRNNERWSLSTFIFERNKLKESDLLIRFYTSGKDSKNTPRLEPFVNGIWYNGFETNGDTWEGAGYGGSLYFNNFISGTFKIPTPNIVLGIIGEHREEVSHGISHFDTYGPSLRFFGRNQQDSAIYLNLKNTQRQLENQYYEEWNWEAAAVIYLAQGLRVEGSWLFPNSDWMAFPSNYAAQKGFKIGGGIEIGILRISGFYENTNFEIKNPAANARQFFNETRRIIQIGLSI
ncbi:hypothetical protein [Fluviispira multicolorata]|uniref:Uncharacterized protein n=1 Tax=Fluviispira multicolorata TaxID=2654512 RepID=A0A833JFG8_9BACT|nr:hypothetical protein [Fluviispira multicolorata]KAB8033736.1 hypothetical protein GCL57_03240 [Fluviispira multicolorata]